MTLNATMPDPLLRTHSPAQLWSHRMPSPPRLVVPPPALATNGLPDLQVVKDATIDFGASGFNNTEFLRTVTYNNFVTKNAMLEWKYEHRHKAQAVLPFLYLGPSSAARNDEFLKSEGITMVIAVRNAMSAQARLLGSKAAEALGLQYAAIDVCGNQELIAAFPQGIQVINEHLAHIYQLNQSGHPPVIAGTPKKNGKVLVFCESGNERSASLVAAYLMAMYSKDVVTTIQIVQAQRFAVAFDDSLRNLLLTYEDILKAKRDVNTVKDMDLATQQSSNAGQGATDRKIKRSHEEIVDEEDILMEMETPSHEYIENGVARRDGIAPFQD